MKRGIPIRILALLVPALLLVSCSIREADPIRYPDAGTLYISATDTTSGESITNAQVFVDGVPRAYQLPAVIERVRGGDRRLDVRPRGAYPSKSMEITILTEDTSSYQFRYASSDTLSNQNAIVTFNVNQAATISIDEVPLDASSSSPIFVKPGVHSFSVYRAGARTLAPQVRIDTLAAGQTAQYSFTLESAQTGYQVGDLIPEFTLPDENDNLFSVGALRGKVVLINFWFYNCQPCRIEFPELEEVWLDRGEEGFRILSVNVGWYNDTPAHFTAIRGELGLTFPLLRNTQGTMWPTDTFGVLEAPTNILVDESGIIRSRFGSTTFEELMEKLDLLLP